MQHAEYEILLEKRLRKADSPEEALKLDRHIEKCQACRQELQTIRKEEAMLDRAAASFVDGFDWDTAEQALRNRVAREKAMGIAPKAVGLLVTLAIFWPIATIAGWLAYLAVALVLVATFACWEIADRRGARRLIEMANRGGEDLVKAYDDHYRGIRKERLADRIVVIIGGAGLVGLAVYNAVTGDWLDLAIAAMLVDLAVWITRSSLSRMNRHRSDLLDRGAISWNDYLLWPLRKADGEMSTSVEAANRSLRLARVRLVLVHVLLVLLMVERGDTWLAVGAGVALYHAYRIGRKLIHNRRNG